MPRYSVLQIADQVLRIIDRGNLKLNKAYSRREIARMARDVASEMIQGSYEKKRRLGDNQMYSQYIATFTGVTVTKDSRGICYAELPADPDDLQNNEGIMNVWPENASKSVHKRPLIPLPLNADVIFASLPAGALETRFGFRPLRDKIEFSTIREADKERTVLDEKITTVRIQMVTTAPEDVADNEPFPMSPHLRRTLIVTLLSTFGVPEKEIEKLNEE